MGQDANGGDGRGFGAEDERSERDWGPSGGDGGLSFGFDPAAFRAGQEGAGIRGAALCGGRNGGNERRGAWLFVQEIAMA